MEPIFLPKTWSLYKKGLLNKNLTNDIFAGIIVGIVALPLAIAFAVASGVSPEKGIITAVVAGFIVSLLGEAACKLAGQPALLSLLSMVLFKNTDSTD